jgi:hypothetical protein
MVSKKPTMYRWTTEIAQRVEPWQYEDMVDSINDKQS